MIGLKKNIGLVMRKGLVKGRGLLKMLLPPTVLYDSNSVAWCLSDKLSTITKDGSDFMSSWRDFLGSGHDLLQDVGSNQPKWFLNDGVLGDGVDNFMNAIFTLNQPTFIYMVIKQVTWTSSDRLFDGENDLSGIVSQLSTSPNITAYAGIPSSENSNLAVGDFGILRILFNGASSKLQVNESAAVSGDFGSADMGGITLFARANITEFSNTQYKEIIVRKIADTAQDEQDIYDYLAKKYDI